MGYSLLTMLMFVIVIVSDVQERDSVMRIHVSILPPTPSYSFHHITLSRGPCALRQVLASSPF